MAQFMSSLDDQQEVPTIAQLLNQHLLIIGQTGSGKTTTALGLLSQLQSQGETAIVFDPTGEYAQLPNAVAYRLGSNAYLDVGQLTNHELVELLQLSPHREMMIQRAANALRIMKNLKGQNQVYYQLNVSVQRYQNELKQLGTWAQSYPVQLLADQWIQDLVIPYPDSRADYGVLGQQYDYERINRDWTMINDLRETMANPAFQQLFGIRPSQQPLTELNYVLQMFLNQRAVHKTLVIDLSKLKHYVHWQRIVISVLFQHILNYRLDHDNVMPVHLVIDEAHRYLPTDDQLTENGIFQIAREGRKCHLSLMLTTQSPLDLSGRLRSQFSNLLIHHLADQTEMDCLHLGNLPTNDLRVGQAFVKCGIGEPHRVAIALPRWWEKE